MVTYSMLHGYPALEDRIKNVLRVCLLTFVKWFVQEPDMDTNTAFTFSDKTCLQVDHVISSI